MAKTIPYLLFISAAVFFLWSNTTSKERFYQWQFDKFSQQEIVTSKQDIDNILQEFQSVPFAQLTKEYRAQTQYDLKKYTKLAQDANFLIIKGKDIFKFIVGDFRIKDFLPRDNYFYDNLDALGSGKEIHWLIDPQLLYKLLELQDVLSEKGYNETGFSIINGYRHPAYNKKVGGAKLSRHLKGQALDLQIEDINDDGFANQKDKKIVLDLLEEIVIKDSGGIGRYPGSMSVHFDVRGYRARWDSH